MNLLYLSNLRLSIQKSKKSRKKYKKKLDNRQIVEYYNFVICKLQKRGENMELNLQLKEIIESRGIKQSYICEKIGMTPDALSRILNSTRKITGEELLNLCDLLNIDPRSLRQSA